MKLSGIVKSGKLVTDPVAWAIAMRHLDGKRVVVDIDSEKAVRTLRQNSRYWSALVPLAGDFLSKTRDVPLSKEQTHWVLSSAFLGCEETPLGLVPMSTRVLTTKQFSGYCDKVELWLNENGYAVPAGAEISHEEQ